MNRLLCRPLVAAGLLLCLFAPGAVRAQGPPAASPREGPQGPGGPGGGMQDRTFLYANMLRAIDGKATLLLEQGKTDAALKELERSGTIDVPRESPAYEAKVHMIGRLAITYCHAGRRKEALETIQRLLAEVPAGSVAEASAWLDAGEVYRQLSMNDEALKAFDRAIELSEKLARSPRGPAGRPGPHPGGRPMGPPPNPPKGDPR